MWNPLRAAWPGGAGPSRLVIGAATGLALLVTTSLGARAAEDIANPPEDPLPPLPPVMSTVPAEPVYDAPAAAALLKDCESKDFVECFRDWRPPPPPPPPPEPKAAEESGAKPKPERAEAPPPPPPPPTADGGGEPPPSGPLVGKPPPPNPAADKATLEALANAIRGTALEGKIKLPDTPEGGSVDLFYQPTAPKR